MSGPTDRSRYGDYSGANGAEGDKSVGELFNQVTSDLGVLLATQIELAKVELRDEAVRAGRTAKLLGAAAGIGGLAAVLMSFAAAWGIGEAVDSPAIGFLVIGVLFAAVATALFVRGRAQMREVTPIAPKTMATIKEDARWAKGQMR